MDINSLLASAAKMQRLINTFGFVKKDTEISELSSKLVLKELEELGHIARIKELEQTIEEVADDPISKVLLIFNKFHQVATQLRERRHTLLIQDEYDVQDLLHSLLRMFFQDVRPEECCPSYASTSPRTDFLLKRESIMVEVKITKEGKNNTKKLEQELIIDIAHYRKHPDCKTLMCFIYDPRHLIKNPYGFEDDIEKSQGDYKVITRVAPKPS